jgi:hypothetical protein
MLTRMSVASDTGTTRSGKWSPIAGAGLGLIIGLGIGALARVWMRLITTTPPDFTWSGTLFIVGIFAIAGLLCGLVVGARQRGWIGMPMVIVRFLGIFATAIMSLGQGALMAGTLVMGGLAIGRTDWPRIVRKLLVVGAFIPIAGVHFVAAREWPHSWWRLIAAVVVCVLVYGAAASGLAQAYAPMPLARIPSNARWVFVLIAVAPLAVFGGLGGVIAAVALAAIFTFVLRRSLIRYPASRRQPIE